MTAVTRRQGLRRTPSRTLRRAGRLTVLALVLGLLALGVPDSQQASTEATLVKVERARGVDLSPDVIWIAAVGSDARPWENMTRTRGDALQLVGIHVDTGAATAIGIPRDSYVQIPGGGRDRINAAMVRGGPQAMARAMGNLVGVEPDYVLVTRFEGLENMVRAIGRITVRNPYAFSDANLKKGGFEAGKITLGGYDALAFSRIRKGLRDGDFGRSANQQRVLKGIHARIVERQADPGFMERGAAAVLKHTSTDASPAEVYRIAHAIAQVRSSRISTCVVPGSIGNAGAASVVFPDVATARRWGRDARKDATIKRC